jgi:predicted MFS family arabinose efflux permease
LAAALAIGPALGGALSEFAHWRWIFLGAVPCCLVALVPAAVTLRPGGPGTARLTAVGTTALSVAMFAFMALLLDTGPPVPVVVVAVAASLVFVLHERRTAHPLLPRAVIGRRVFVVGAVAQGLWSVAITGLLFVSPPYLERVLGLTPAGSGLFFVPIALAVVVGTPVVAPLVRRIGPWHVSGLGLALVAVALFAIVRLADRAHAGGLLACLALAGFGSALTTPLTTAVLDSVADRFAGVASGAITAARELAGALGVAAVGSTFASGGHPSVAHAYRAGVLVAALAVVVALALTLSAARADKITRQPTRRAVRP